MGLKKKKANQKSKYQQQQQKTFQTRRPAVIFCSSLSMYVWVMVIHPAFHVMSNHHQACKHSSHS